MLTLQVANKAVIKSTWKARRCQKERQRHKSLALFDGPSPLTGGRQPRGLFGLGSVPSAQRARYEMRPRGCSDTRPGPERPWGACPRSGSLLSCRCLEVAAVPALLCRPHRPPSPLPPGWWQESHPRAAQCPRGGRPWGKLPSSFSAPIHFSRGDGRESKPLWRPGAPPWAGPQRAPLC